MELSTTQSYLALLQAGQFSPALFSHLLSRFGSLAQIRSQSTAVLANFGLSEAQIRLIFSRDIPRKAAKECKKSLKWAKDRKNQIINFESPTYPPRLKEIPVPPPLLYIQGNSSILRSPMISIVGSRRSSSYGNRNAKWLAFELAKAGFTVCSGLARGIDGQAHQGALKAKGYTIAVVATGLDQVYPLAHQNLAEDIRDLGLIISEFPLGTPPRKENFPQRNRIISGMSLGVVVVEASMKSGSLITARLALEQNRDVFTIPGSIDSSQSKGCHWLIKQGAKLIESPEEVVEDYGDFEFPNHEIVKEISARSTLLSKVQESILVAIGQDQVLMDYLLDKTGLSMEVLSSELTELEISGYIEAKGGRFFQPIK